MSRYIQRIRLLGKEKWVGWEIDGIGTEVPGLTLADELSEEELRARGVKEFAPMPFERFVGLGAALASQSSVLLDDDVEFRLDALLVGMERLRCGGRTDVPRLLLTTVFGDEQHIDDPRVQARLRAWERDGRIELVGRDDCYVRITGRLA